jgi:hypothetical protein
VKNCNSFLFIKLKNYGIISRKFLHILSIILIGFILALEKQGQPPVRKPFPVPIGRVLHVEKRNVIEWPVMVNLLLVTLLIKITKKIILFSLKKFIYF